MGPLFKIRGIMAKKKEEDSVKKEIESLAELMRFEIESLDDFDIYNRGARLFGRPVKSPSEEYHEKMTVKFQRFDQPENVLKTRVRNKDIDWTGALKPGKTYDLPVPVVKFLNSLAVPIYEEVEVKDGGETVRETQQVGERPRFSCMPVF